MERLTATVPAETLGSYGFGNLFEGVERHASHILRMDRRLITLLLRVRPLRPDLLPEEWLANPAVVRGKFLRGDGGEWLVLVTVRPSPVVREFLSTFPDLYLHQFTGVRERAIEFSLLGERGRLQSYLAWARGKGLPVEVVRFEPVSSETRDRLEALTPRQQQALRAAYALGYFETPRRVTLRELAQTLRRDPSSVMALLRRAQKRMLEEAFGQGVPPPLHPMHRNPISAPGGPKAS